MNTRLQQELNYIDAWFEARLAQIEREWQLGLYTAEQADHAEQIVYEHWLEACNEVEKQFTTSL